MRLIDADALREEFRNAAYPGGGTITMFDIMDIEAELRAAPTVSCEGCRHDAYCPVMVENVFPMGMDPDDYAAAIALSECMDHKLGRGPTFKGCGYFERRQP